MPHAQSALVLALLWAAVLAGPLLGWALACGGVGPGANPRPRRAAFAVGQATAFLPAGFVLLRGVALFAPQLAGGPVSWVRYGMGRLSSAPPRVFPLDAVVVLALVHTAVLAVAAPLMALRGRRRSREAAFSVPMAAPLALVLGLVSLLAPLVLDAPLRLERDYVLLDGLAALPVVCVALAIWTRAERVPLSEPYRAPTAPPVEPPPVDVPALWLRLGAIEGSRPMIALPGESSASSPPGPTASAWTDAGALGPPPGALDAIALEYATPGQGWLVGDLPDPTERQFLTACLLLALHREARSCMVVTERPAALRDEVASALKRRDAWAPGALVAGEKEWVETLAGGRLPAAVFLEVEQLSGGGLRALWGSPDSRSQVWTRSVGLVVLSRVDRGTPMAATHRVLTLRRLSLALTAAGAQFNVLATGMGGSGTRALVEHALPGIPVRQVPFAPRASAPVRVWCASQRFIHSPGAPWLSRAIAPLAAARLPVSLGDPGGAFDGRIAEETGPDVRFTRDVPLDGLASISVLDEAWLLAAFRTLAHRAPLPRGHAHDTLWGVADTPLTRFLLRNNNLRGLSQHGQLPVPRPLVGRDNAALALGHLRAALHEGAQDLESLIDLFGRSRVEQVLGADFTPHRFTVRPSVTGMRRSAQVPALSTAPENPLRGTVTDLRVRILDENRGRLLDEVDRLLVETRYYPGRVFAVGNTRYEVPLNAYDTKRGEIRVQPLADDRPLTRPHLRITFLQAEAVQAPQRVHENGGTFEVTTLEVVAHEEVSGYRKVGQAGGVELPKVTSRYRTRARALFFPARASHNAWQHLARSMDDVLVAHLLSRNEDLEVVPVDPGMLPGMPAGLVVLDRSPGGMGATEALDLPVLQEILRWVEAILRNCPCPDGCPQCTPQDVLDIGPDKSGVLQLLSQG